MKRERREFITQLGTVAVSSVFIDVSSEAFAQAAAIKVFSSPAMRGILRELGQDIEGATGHKLVVEYDVFAVLKRRIDAGEMFDVAILSPDLIDDLIKMGKIAVNTRTDLGRHGVGVGMLNGASRPDISSADALKRTMLNARSVAYFREGTAGQHFLSVLDRLGIANDMKSKLKAYDADAAAQAVLTGDAEFIVAGIGTILALPAVELVGGLPPELQSFTAYAVGVSAGTKQREAARALIRFLTGPKALQVMRANGLEP